MASRRAAGEGHVDEDQLERGADEQADKAVPDGGVLLREIGGDRAGDKEARGRGEVVAEVEGG